MGLCPHDDVVATASPQEVKGWYWPPGCERPQLLWTLSVQEASGWGDTTEVFSMVCWQQGRCPGRVFLLASQEGKLAMLDV
eukprot:9471730-Pyramimonas_sp.AAC.1